MCIWYLVQRHTVKLDGFVILAHFVVNISHVDSKSPRVVKHAVFSDDLVRVQRFCIHVVGSVLVCKVKQNLLMQNYNHLVLQFTEKYHSRKAYLIWLK